MVKTKAPFPYFGGKSSIGPRIWEILGDVPNFVDPFCGSCAVLLGRPASHQGGIETINDKCAFVENFWRAIQKEPETMAELMNWPVNETALTARHKWLVTAARKRQHAERMHDDPDYYDVKIAAWWCWGLAAWIGRGWCAGEWHGRGSPENHGDGINVQDEERGGKRPNLIDAGQGVHRQLPHLGDAGKGVHRQLPHLGDAGQGVHRQRPHLGDAGKGVHRQLPHLGDAGQGECERRGEVLRQWMRALQDRLRNVRVCCGDWKRILGPSPTIKLGITGVVFDPPYSGDAGRDKAIYNHEDLEVAHEVREWCLKNGDNKDLRIILCGYEGEGHEELERHGWIVEKWKAHGGYGVLRGKGTYTNKNRERLWCSPGCLDPEELFR